MTTPIARRNVRVEIQANNPTRGVKRDEKPNWSTVATVWGFVRGLSGRELVNADQTKASTSRVVECAWPGSLVTVTALHRLKVGTRLFGITSVVDVDERHRTLLITCVEQTQPAPA